MGRGGLGGLEGRVSGGLHQSVPHVLPLDSLMAVQGSLIPWHQRLEGRAFPVVKQQAGPAGHYWELPLHLLCLGLPGVAPRHKVLRTDPPPPPPLPPPPSVCSSCCCPCAPAFGLGLRAYARRWSRSRSVAVAVARRSASCARCSASWSLPRKRRTSPSAATARFCHTEMAPAYAATQASTCAAACFAGRGFAAEG